MHQQVLDYVAFQIDRYGLDKPDVTVLDLGGRDINGTTRHLFTAPSRYVVVDIAADPSVDVVADAGTLNLDERFDVVTSTECLEHALAAPAIVGAAFNHLVEGGVFIATMAGPGRGRHGASGEPAPPPGEWYKNVEPGDLLEWLDEAGFVEYEISRQSFDVRCTAWRP